MSAADDFIQKLKALQVQGYQKQYIIDVWASGKEDVLIILAKELVFATLKDDFSEVVKIKRAINNIKKLNKRIQVGLLEENKE
jgi:hypothetical protein